MIPLIDYGAIADLRKKMAASQAPAPTQGQPAIQPMPQVPIQAPPPPPLLAPPPPNQMLPVAEGPPVANDLPKMPSALSRLVSGINDIGKPQLDEDTRSLLTPKQVRSAESGGGLLGRLAVQALTMGMFTPSIQARGRAEAMLAGKVAAGKVKDEQQARQDAQTEREGLAAVRAEMPPPPDGNDYAATLSWNRQFIAKLMGRGLIKQAWQMSQYLDTTPPREPQSSQPLRPIVSENVPENGKFYRIFRDPITLKEIGRDEMAKPATPDKPKSQLIEVDNGDGTVTRRWINEGESVTSQQKAAAGAATKNDQQLAARDAQFSMNSLLTGDGKMKDPPGWSDRIFTRYDFSNIAASPSGQTYMKSVRNLIRSWAVIVEGKRMSDADAIANDQLKSFRFGDSAEADALTKQRLESMAQAIKDKMASSSASPSGPIPPKPASATDEEWAKYLKDRGYKP